MERFPSQPSVEQPKEMPDAEYRKGLEANLEKIEHGLEDVSEARGYWVNSLDILSAEIPHNDNVVDEKTYSYDVAKNVILHNIMELGDHEEKLLELKEQVTSHLDGLDESENFDLAA